MSFNSDYGQARISPFYLARVGGVTSRQLDQLALTATVQNIHAALTAESSMRALAPLVEDALYRLVPRAEGQDELRRRILLVKRNVHNLRFWPAAEKDIAVVCEALSDKVERSRLKQWHRSARDREDALSKAGVSYAQEVADAGAALARSLGDATLQSGLALASSTMSAELKRAFNKPDARDWRPASKLSRSSLAYLTRAALKTSPFSTFTQLAVSEFAHESRAVTRAARAIERTQESGDSVQTGNTLQLLKAIPLSLLSLSARDPELAPALSYALNESLRLSPDGSGAGHMLKSQYVLEGGFAWRQERVANVAFNSQTIPALYELLRREKSISYAALVDFITAIRQSPDSHKVVCQLLDAQFIRPVAPYSRLEQRPLLAIARALEPLNSQRAAHTVGKMRLVEGQIEASRTAVGSIRLEHIESIRRMTFDLFEELDAAPPPFLKSANLLYEDVRFDGAPAVLSAEIQNDLMKVADMLRPRMVRTQIYDYLYRYFVDTLGRDGECADILSFLEGFLSQRDVSELFMRAIAEDELDIKEAGGNDRSKLPTGASASSPALTLFFQVAAESRQALARGDYRLVVNQANSGQGGLLSRFCELLGAEHGDLSGKLKLWLEQVYGGREVVEVPIVADWSNLQSARGFTERALQWPSETPTTESDPRATLALHELRLRIDADEETFYFVDAQGKTIAPTYLGVVPTHLIGSALRLFLLLIDPWSSDYAVGWHYGRLYKETVRPDEIQFFPRQEQGRIVLRRARWYCPVEQIPVPQKGESDFDFFVRVQRWRLEHNLPEEVFAVAEREEVALESKHRKPIWINFQSPHTLELLRQLVDSDSPVLSFTEVLPARRQHWIRPSVPARQVARDAGAGDVAPEGRASEFMCLVHWPMPGPAAPSKRAVGAFRNAGERPHHNADDWLCFNIYPEQGAQLDEVIRHLVRPIRDLVRADRDFRGWFFVRYIDQRGPHIRLRLQGSARMRHELATAVGALIESRLPQLPPGHTRRQILTNPHQPPLPVSAHGYTLETYQPEYVKYGGHAGVEIAERLFEASSEITLRALALEQPASLDPLLLAAAFAESGLSKTHPEASARERFLRRYLWYWSGQNRPGANDIRLSLEREVERRLAETSQDLAALTANAMLRGLVDEYGRAFDDTLSSLAQAAGHVLAQPGHLCFDYIHMNNNRLGILPVEEAYLAALLLTMGESAAPGYEQGADQTPTNIQLLPLS